MAAVASTSVSALLRAPVSSNARASNARVVRGAIGIAKRGTSSVASRRAGVVVSASVEEVIPQLAVDLPFDTTAFDEMFVNAASIILPAWGAIVGTIFVFGTIAKVAFPDKYDDAVYKNKAKELVQDEIIDLDNLSEADLAAVAALEKERAEQGK
ncbi:uncharacterized protein MICPUCDRAFT_46673 [Micromonas pusilla CCMP1545]|uniref:Predicted protein n=1 Tax=Micromonas pusilla (strain CCMP1545) TaxID=564608 RepID=C1MPA1_MICPC|nr:uncharacterized protein MICPUCDRAFT_46673 [Micromonas pusilla CCMP1545]EEH58894.1 predicted protein [Micromonas pusilla CCMP1545]|eukprot:XP_003057249.1 predicted protein [Micromonas pusilla CCMP1545]